MPLKALADAEEHDAPAIAFGKHLKPQHLAIEAAHLCHVVHSDGDLAESTNREAAPA
jgi:hypothetical protein